ncbi:7669_t:CDS:2, partial [Diversispora eburnea]
YMGYNRPIMYRMVPNWVAQTQMMANIWQEMLVTALTRAEVEAAIAKNLPGVSVNAVRTGIFKASYAVLRSVNYITCCNAWNIGQSETARIQATRIIAVKGIEAVVSHSGCY